MRTQIDEDVLELSVNLICDTLDTFSAYDVTKILRARLPHRNIKHEEVRPIVNDYVVANALKVSDNGTFRVYSRVKTTVPAKITYDDREDDGFNPCKEISNNTVDKMKSMINSFGTSKVTKYDPTSPIGVNVTTRIPSTKILERKYNLASENRLTIPVDVFNKLSNKSGRYTLSRSSNKIVIVPETNTTYSGGKIRAGQRFRTLFPNNVRMVNVAVYNDRIEVVPV